MKRFAITGVGFLAALTLSAIAASPASALPDISITLSGSAYPLHLNYESTTVKTKLAGAAATFKGTGVKLLFLLNALSALGTFHAEFKGIETETGEQCNNVGETRETGIVSWGGSFHIVYTSLTSETDGLRMGILLLPLTVEEECGDLELVLKGSVLSSFNVAGSEGTELTNASGQLLGTVNGKAQITKYWNDSGVVETARLLISISGGAFRESDQRVEETMLLTALSPDMFVVTRR